MALAISSIAKVLKVAGMITKTVGVAVKAAAPLVATVAGAQQISAQISAKKRARSLAQQAERTRVEESKRAKTLVARAEELPAIAKTEAASIAAGRRRHRRATLATGPRGLFGEPNVMKPTLLGA